MTTKATLTLEQRVEMLEASLESTQILLNVVARTQTMHLAGVLKAAPEPDAASPSGSEAGR